MATIQTRKSKAGVESYRVGYYDEHGKFKYSPTFATRESAERLATIIEARGAEVAMRLLNKQDTTAKAGPTLAEWFEDHLKAKTGRIEEGTIAGYRSEAARTWLPRLGALPLDMVTRKDIRDWVAWQQTQETSRSAKRRATLKKAGATSLPPVELVAPKTVRNAHATLSSVLEAATLEEPPLIMRNPAKGIEVPKDHHRDEEPIFTHEEWEIFYECVDDHYKLFVDFLLQTGVRISEATAFPVKNLNVSMSSVSVLRSWKKGAKGQTLGTPKSRRSRRTIMIAEGPMQRYAEHAMNKHPEALLFTALRGGRINAHQFTERQWARALAKSGIQKHLTPKSLRHTFASWQLMAGVPPQVVQERLGHESLSTTSLIYGHLLLQAQQRGADVMSWSPPTHPADSRVISQDIHISTSGKG